MSDGLELIDLTIRTGSVPLCALSARVRPGEILSVMGPSGSGKSTLLAAIAGTLAPAFDLTGQVRLNGRALNGLRPERRRVGLMFQDALLFPHMSVGANLGFGLQPGPGRRARIDTALTEIGLPGFADRDPATLSGGQAARVALMRTLLSQPQALLLDEPFSRLDADLRDQIRALTFAMARDLPVLMVTHDDADARAAGGDIIRL